MTRREKSFSIWKLSEAGAGNQQIKKTASMQVKEKARYVLNVKRRCICDCMRSDIFHNGTVNMKDFNLISRSIFTLNDVMIDEVLLANATQKCKKGKIIAKEKWER
ncbi:MAG: hypothetical protein JW804_00595 [Sedimentisphaerales bacterium]|nr:hypothetical protein [Sedimentisphaerales bacterium]